VDISKLTDEEKSVMLARVMGQQMSLRKIGADGYNQWSYIGILVNQAHKLHSRLDQDAAFEHATPNLYDSAYMSLAWMVAVWAWRNLPVEPIQKGHNKTTIRQIFRVFWATKIRPTSIDAQRLWLDKILKLACEAELVEDDGFKRVRGVLYDPDNSEPAEVTIRRIRGYVDDGEE